MIRYRLAALFLGSVRIMASGRALEKFVNQLVVSGIVLMEIHYADGTMTARMLAPDFKRLRRPARATHTKVKIIARGGLVFALRRLEKRKVIAWGAVALAVLLVYLNSRIWVIEIRGSEKIPLTAISEALERAGVKPGVSKSQVNPREVEGIILQSVRGISWAGVRLEGGKAIVEVVEKITAPEKHQGPCDIVARKPGVVTEIIVFSGTPMVREGQTVSQGQVLISGEMSHNEVDANGKQVTVKRSVEASGIVKARVWYQTYTELPLEYLRPSVTGKTLTRFGLRLGSMEIELMSFGTPVEGPKYVEVKRLAPPQWRNIILPVEVTKTVYNQLQYEIVAASAEELQIKAAEEARAALQESLPPGAEVVDTRLQVRRGEDFVGVVAMVETIEDIGLARPVAGGDVDIE